MEPSCFPTGFAALCIHVWPVLLPALLWTAELCAVPVVVSPTGSQIHCVTLSLRPQRFFPSCEWTPWSSLVHFTKCPILYRESHNKPIVLIQIIIIFKTPLHCLKVICSPQKFLVIWASSETHRQLTSTGSTQEFRGLKSSRCWQSVTWKTTNQKTTFWDLLPQWVLFVFKKCRRNYTWVRWRPCYFVVMWGLWTYLEYIM